MGNVEMKYTDRDLRANHDLYEDVYRYLRNYTGEFDFLVAAKLALEASDNLPIGVARGVLNCMRADPRVAHSLPAPMPVPEGEVLIFRKKNKKRRYGDTEQCALTDSHDSHSHRPDGTYLWCPGIPFEINREGVYQRDALVKARFALARTGAFIHGTTGQGRVTWYVPRHEYGWMEPQLTPDLWVKTLCKIPSWVKNPTLFKLFPDPRTVVLHEEDGDRVITVCPKCYPLGWQDIPAGLRSKGA